MRVIYDSLAEQITKAQDKLREREQDNYLLPLVTIGGATINTNPDFKEHYNENDGHKSLWKYLNDLLT